MMKYPHARARVRSSGVIMGSQSDWDTMRQADEMLTEFDVPHECRVVSAHRTPALDGRVRDDGGRSAASK